MSAEGAVPWQIFVLFNPIEDVLSAGPDILLHGLVLLQIKNLGEVAGDEIAPSGEDARVGLEEAGGDAEKGGFPGSVTAD